MSLRAVKSLLWAVAGAALVVLVARYTHGLGAATALTDTTPWGIWKSVNVLGGVALAAGGFSLAAAVYIFHLDRFHALARRGVLIAFCGYGTVAVSLAFDLGDPLNIWRPILYWQTDSVMFEVAWCVMLYLLVLTVEVGVVILERTRFKALHRVLKRISIPAVILGIGLSSLHQSSLGSLFLIMPHRLHPLWYTPLLPVLFIVSAVALGLLVVVGESLVTAALYRRPVDRAVSGLGRAAGWVLVFYGALRIGDLAYRGGFGHLAWDTWEGWLFVVEMGVSTVLPASLLLFRVTRESHRGLLWAVGMVVVGMLLHRINASGLSGVQLTGDRYLPAWTEVVLSAGVIAAALLFYFFTVEHFAVYEEPLRDPSPAKGMWRRVSDVMIPQVACGDRQAGLRAHSLAFVASAALTLALLPDSALHGAEPAVTPVHRARGGRVLLVDGNRNGDAVAFDHATHVSSAGGKKSCGKCHHMNHPFDQATSCSACHRDMYLATDIFSHRSHVRHLGDKHSCGACHLDHDQKKVRANTRACTHCHRTMWSKRTLARVKDPRDLSRAMGYRQALHRQCIGCHRKKAKEYEMAEMAQCAFCHKPLDKKVMRTRRELEGHR